MDFAKRWLVGQMLHVSICLMRHPLSEMWRCFRIHYEGLTPKERDYLKKRLDAVETSLLDLTKLSTRVRHSTGKMARHGT